ncbi:MAG: hypothetical protein A4E74_00379 [Syntrophus sp. PtaB.Bin075]|nr:MAG: hypothetical protein A4E74_00379 [Syntrophus sp. PtaB.Bin075]
MTELQRLIITRKEGEEPFHANGVALGFDLRSFWQWSASDLVSNATRGIIAEYIVARSLSLVDKGVRDEWAAFDLETPSGVKIEVKSAAYIQSWHQERLSSITFRTPKTRAWDPDTSTQSVDVKRQADVYVFALLSHNDKQTIDPLNVKQWRFYVTATSELNERKRSQHSITLKSLEQLCSGPVTYEELPRAVGNCIGKSLV